MNVNEMPERMGYLRFYRCVGVCVLMLGLAGVCQGQGLEQDRDIASQLGAGPVPPPPQMLDWVAPIEDPLHTHTPVSRQMAQYPSNLYSGNVSVCITADEVTRPYVSGQVVERLLALANAQEDEGQGKDNAYSAKPVVDLLLALDLGLCHNPQVRGAWSEIRLQASSVGQARAAYFPTLNAALTHQSSETKSVVTPFWGMPYTDTETVENTSGYLSLTWRLLDFGTRRATLASAHYQLAGAVYTQNATLQQAIIEIVQAYYNAQTTRARWQARQQLRGLAEQIRASAQRRLERGAGSQNDVLQASSALAQAQLEEVRSEGEYRKSMAELAYLLGLPVDILFELDNTLEQDMQEMDEPQTQEQQRIFVQQALQDWLEQARRHHPAIAAARAQWYAAQRNIEATQAQGLPTVDLSMNYYRNGRPTDGANNTRRSERNIGVTLNIPIFTGFEHTYRVRGAQAQADQQRARMEMVEQQTMLELVRTYSDAQTAWHTLDAAQAMYTAALQALESSRRQLERGAADMTQVIQAQDTLVDAVLQRIEAQAQWQSARLTLIVQGYAWER